MPVFAEKVRVCVCWQADEPKNQQEKRVGGEALMMTATALTIVGLRNHGRRETALKT